MFNFFCKNIIGFQSSATPIMEGIVDLHNYIFFYLILIFFFVLWIYFYILYSFYVLPTYLFNFSARLKNFFDLYIISKVVFFKWVDNLYVKYVFTGFKKKQFDFFIYKRLKKHLKVLSIWQSIRTNYSRRITHGTFIEIVWTLIPSFILVLIALPSFALLYAMDEIIDPMLTVKVIGYQWFWTYEYNRTMKFDDYYFFTDMFDYNYKVGRDDEFLYDSVMINEDDLEKGYHRLLEVDKQFILPVDTHIRVVVSSADVLHSFAVPSLGIKIDAVPGRLSQVSLYLKRQGVFYGQCSELCGVNHGFMPISVKVVSQANFFLWNSTFNFFWNIENVT